MPTRSTADISHEQLTDHDIQANPKRSSLDIDRPDARVRARSCARWKCYGRRARAWGWRTRSWHSTETEVLGEKALDCSRKPKRRVAMMPTSTIVWGIYSRSQETRRVRSADYLAALRQNAARYNCSWRIWLYSMLELGRAREAVKLLTQVVKEDPSQTSAGLNLAFLECRMGHKEDAAAVVRRMLEFNPDSA
jgi:tetratricopeptide (TPR) repeat protein